MPALTSISPSSGAPGTAITLTGSGFDSTARVGCPALVATTVVSATELTAEIPADLMGAGGTSMLIGVYVFNGDGSVSNSVTWTVSFPDTSLQSWTSIEDVCGEVPQFVRGERAPVKDATIRLWMKSITQTVNSVLMRRGLPTNPAEWPTVAAGNAMPVPAGVLGQMVRLGAAARLASAIGAQFSADKEWGLAVSLRRDFERELAALGAGEYDRAFNDAAAVAESGQLVEAGDVFSASGGSTQAFTKGQVF